ncbi:DUF1949 domain-containing protein [Nakamurella silvestris]|nr:DUF1949 domain-containing protein [Nakamurella silvestris]
MSTHRYQVPAGPAAAEIEVKRSRFIAALEPVADEAAARSFIDGRRKAHHGARHHCSAFILGADRMTERSNDDGEPAGTAGAPMLEAIRGSGVSDIVAVVTRYFGGTLLGAGGLSRAYGESMSAALAGMKTLVREEFSLFELPVDHATAGRVEAELRHRRVLVRGVAYGARAVLRLAVGAEELGSLEQIVAAVTTGDGELTAVGTEWVTLPSGR